MGKAKKAAIAFIDDLSDGHLTNLKSKSGTITKDTNFRLDMQGFTTGSKDYNLQIQINNETSISTLSREKGKTVSTVLVPVDAEWSAADIRTRFKDNLKI